MPLYRHPESPYWWCRFSIGGTKVRRSTGTASREAAEEFESRLRADLWRQVRLGERPRYTWKEAVTRWYDEAETRGREHDRDRLKWFDAHLEAITLDDITPTLIDKLRALRLAESSKSTANRYLALLRMILRRAEREWRWIDRAPFVRMFSIEKQEPRFLTRAQFAALKKKLPAHLAALAEFSVETGLRMRNATGLLWSQVDLARGILIVPASRAKAGETISIPLSGRARAIVRAQRGAHESHVFVYRGKPMDDCNGHRFKRATREAGVPWLRWHDLRHTWASWQIQRGVPPHVLRDLGGWSSDEMVRRYGHLSVDHLREWVPGAKKGTAKRVRRAG